MQSGVTNVVVVLNTLIAIPRFHSMTNPDIIAPATQGTKLRTGTTVAGIAEFP
jgi:hypothetical protein